MLKKLKRSALGASVPHEKVTAGMATEKMPIPEQIILPMSQHIGAPCKPVVQKGDTVMVGSLVGEAGGFVSANIYSGVSGEVTAVEQVLSATGAMGTQVVIKPDGLQTVDPEIKAPVVTDKASFIQAVRDCGLVGLGGAGFPAAVKLNPATPVDTLVINGAECVPYLTPDTREFLECSDTVLSGIEAVMHWLEIPNCVIGIERNKPECIDLMCSLVSGKSGITVHPLPCRYPQGAEKTLIESCTGREVPELVPGDKPRPGLPADVGVIVMNVTSVSTIGKFLKDGMPLTTKRVTVDGDAVANPKNVEAVIGTQLKDIVAFCGGVKEGVELGKVIYGGPMMGKALPNLDAPLLRQNNGVLLFSREMATLPQPSACIRCGRCIEGCPMGLAPVQISAAYERRDVEALTKLKINLCVECGTCSFVCPAKRPVTQTMSLAKAFQRTGGK